MDELVYLRNDEAVCSSLQVAEKFEKRHDNVMRSIEGLLKNEETHEMFKNSSYIEEQNNQRYPMYLMNRDGFSLLVMGFTGKKALDWKLQYIKAFNQMEKFIREKQTQTWIETRKAGKLTRKAETDTIKNLVEYAKGQGSQHADKLYMTYSKLANKMAGISKRDEATVMQLNNFCEYLDAIAYISVGEADTQTLGTLKVTSEAGSEAGTTKLTVKEQLMSMRNCWKYKDAAAATAVTYGMDVKNWSKWDGESEIASTATHHITLVECDQNYKAVRSGDVAVTVNPGA